MSADRPVRPIDNIYIIYGETRECYYFKIKT